MGSPEPRGTIRTDAGRGTRDSSATAGTVVYGPFMNPEKQHRKLEKLQLKAEECLTREEAQKIIKKADKAHRKLEGG